MCLHIKQRLFPSKALPFTYSHFRNLLVSCYQRSVYNVVLQLSLIHIQMCIRDSIYTLIIAKILVIGDNWYQKSNRLKVDIYRFCLIYVQTQQTSQTRLHNYRIKYQVKKGVQITYHQCSVSSESVQLVQMGKTGLKIMEYQINSRKSI